MYGGVAAPARPERETAGASKASAASSTAPGSDPELDRHGLHRPTVRDDQGGTQLADSLANAAHSEPWAIMLGVEVPLVLRRWRTGLKECPSRRDLHLIGQHGG
jgi:hypothetical protein